MKQALLLSYPRSGNTWLRYCVERLTGMRTDTGKDLDAKRKLVPETPDNAPWILTKEHWAKSSYKNGYMILLLRDYHEVLVREPPVDLSLEDRMKLVSNENIINYLRCVQQYHNWDPNKRYLIYYQDLVNDPVGTLRALLSWLEVDHKDPLTFFEPKNIEAEKDRCFSLYENLGNKSKTKGLILRWFRYQVPEEIHERWRRYAMDNHPELYQYLERFDLPHVW